MYKKLFQQFMCIQILTSEKILFPFKLNCCGKQLGLELISIQVMILKICGTTPSAAFICLHGTHMKN